MFLLHYTSRILCSINSRKAFKFLSKRLALLLYGNQYRHLYFVLAKQRICGQWGVPGVGNCLFLRARRWGIDHQVRKKLQIPGGMPWGEMVTGRIEPCINFVYHSILVSRRRLQFAIFFDLSTYMYEIKALHCGKCFLLFVTHKLWNFHVLESSIRTWSHPLIQSVSSISMLYIP